MREYVTYKGVECLSSCLYNFLVNKGIKIGHSDIFFVGNGFKLFYTGHYEERMIYSNQYRCNMKFMKMYMKNTDIRYYSNESEEKMMRYMDELLRKNNEIVIRVSSAHLPYNQVFKKDIIVSHYINVLDYNRDTYLISDGCPPVKGDNIYQEWIDKRDVINSWNLMNGEYFIPVLDESDLSHVKEYADSVLIRQLKEYVKNKFGFYRKRYSGYGCIITLFEDIKPLFDKEIENIPEIVMDCVKQLKINGFIQSKEFLKLKLQENFGDNEVSRMYAENLEKWNRVLLMFAKSGIKRDAELFEEVLKKVLSLTYEERKIIQMI